MPTAALTRLTTAALSLGLLASAAAAPADAATRSGSQAKAPTISRFGPATLGIGDVLTIRGTTLKVGKVTTRVAFQRRGGRAVFAKATKASATRLQVVVPEALRAQLPVVGGTAQPARFRLRVLTTRFGKAFTTDAASPMIGPAAAAKAAPATTPAPATAAPSIVPVAPALTTPAEPTTTAPAPTPDPSTTPADPSVPTPPPCVTTPASGDTDGDLLTNAEELRYGTDPCAKDSDGDGVTDYFEQRSALDLNSVALPYPGARPYPNPLDRTDATTDFDGDGLTLEEEQTAWRASGSPRTLTYSDGTQYTGGRHAVGTVPGTDIDRNGVLSDDERDLDGDGLTNWDELHGRATPGWWIAAFKDETPYVLRTYDGLDFTKADTDGDGVRDGADDEDHDGFTNLQELQRPSGWAETYVSTAHAGTDTRARVNPFNPCKPFFSSKCHVHPPFGAYPDTEDWASPVHEDGP